MEYTALSKIYYKGKEQYEEVYKARISNTDALYPVPVDIKGNPAFVVTSKEIYALTQQLYIRNNKLTRLYGSLPEVAITAFLRKSIVEEILLSNDIEGVYSSKKQLQVLVRKKTGMTKEKFAGMINKYTKILDDDEVPLETSKDIRLLYDELILPEIENGKEPDGKIFRKDSVSVYTATDKEIHRGINPEAQIIELMDKSLSWLNTESIPLIIRIAVFHYLFGYIHPFYDGNGRLSRFISSQLLKKTLNYLVSFRISYSIINNKNAYYNAFVECNDAKNKGDLTPFVIEFLNILLMNIESLITELQESQAKLRHYDGIGEEYYKRQLKIYGNSKHERIIKAEGNVLYLLIQNLLFNGDMPMSISELAEAVNNGVNWTRKLLIAPLSENYILRERQGHSFVYSANLDEIDKLQSK
jgi:Fic family protein